MERKAHLSGIGFAIIFGFSFMFSKIALNVVSPIGLIAYRFLLAFLGFSLLRATKIVVVRLEKRHFVLLFLVALCQPVLYFLFETFGLEQTSSGEAGMMIALIPIVVSILSTLFLKEKPRVIQLLFIALSVGGILFIQFSKENQPGGPHGWGFLLLAFAVLSAALYNIASRKASKTLKPHEVTYFMMLMGALVFNIIYVIQLLIQGDITQYVTLLLNLELVLPLLYLGLVASIGGFFLVNYTLSRLPAHVSSIYSNLSTVVAIVAGAIFLQETLAYYHYLGAIMIIGGVYGTVWMNRHPSPKVMGLLPEACSNSIDSQKKESRH